MESQDVLLAYITRLNLGVRKGWTRRRRILSFRRGWLRPRLNFRSRKSRVWQGMDEAWLSTRLKLMQRFLIPSLKAQHDQDFVWLVLVHPDTPESVLRKISVIPQCRILKTESEVTNSALIASQSVAYLHNLFSRKLLITVRLDSDDGVNPAHGTVLKDIAANQTVLENGIFTDFPEGSFFNVRTGRGCLRRSESRSCGLSRIEKFNSDATTIYCGHHGRISALENCISVDTDEPMWIQTTHNSHINRPRKKLPKIRRHRGTNTETRKIVELFPSIEIG